MNGVPETTDPIKSAVAEAQRRHPSMSDFALFAMLSAGDAKRGALISSALNELNGDMLDRFDALDRGTTFTVQEHAAADDLRIGHGCRADVLIVRDAIKRVTERPALSWKFVGAHIAEVRQGETTYVVERNTEAAIRGLCRYDVVAFTQVDGFALIAESVATIDDGMSAVADMLAGKASQ